MQSYLKFIKDTSLLLGFDLDNRLESKPKAAKLLTVWKFIVPIFYVINLFQLFGYLHSPNLGYHQRIISFLTILVTIQGILRFFVIYMGIAKMMNLIKKIEKLQKTRFKENHSVSGSKFIEIIRKIGTVTSRVIVFAPMIYVVIGNVKIFISFVMKTPLDEIMVIGLYWPFDPYNYLPWTFIYIYLMEFLKTTTVLITDHVTILTTACLSLCFESLANEVEEIFKGARNRSFRDTKQKLIDFVEVHIQLRTLCDELNGLHGISLLTFFVLQSVVTCILGFEAMTNDAVATRFVYGLSIPIASLHLFVIFYVGEKLKSSNLKIAHQITNIELYHVDILLKRDVLFIAQVSNRPKFLTALGFFQFDLSTYTTFVNSTYSYLALLRKIYC